MTAEEDDIPKVYLDFRDKLFDLMTKVTLYASLQCDQDDVRSAMQAVYREFNGVVERAYYMQETIRAMHEIGAENRDSKG